MRRARVDGGVRSTVSERSPRRLERLATSEDPRCDGAAAPCRGRGAALRQGAAIVRPDRGRPPRGDREPSYLFLVEFDTPPSEEEGARVARELDRALCRHNIEYASKRKSGRLAPAVLRVLEPGQFDAYQRRALQAGAPDGQFKILRLTTDEGFARHFAGVVRDFGAV